MKIESCKKESFTVIGKEGSTEEGSGFIQRLWEEANAHFEEIRSLAKTDETGGLSGFWGAMSDVSRAFRPWEENFSKGLYLAGAECLDDAEPPAGWVKWVIPGYEYICVKTEGQDVFLEALAYLKKKKVSLAGAAHDFICPKTGESYMFFPIKRLDSDLDERLKV